LSRDACKIFKRWSHKVEKSHTSAKSDDFSLSYGDFTITSAILHFRSPIIGSLKSRLRFAIGHK